MKIKPITYIFHNKQLVTSPQVREHDSIITHNFNLSFPVLGVTTCVGLVTLSRGEIISHIFMIGEMFATLHKALKVKRLPSHRNYERGKPALLMLHLEEMALRSWKKTLLGHKAKRRPTSSSKGFKYTSKRGESTYN